MDSIRRILIPWELFQHSIEEEVVATVATREDEPEAMEAKNVVDDDYVDQEEPKEMDMEAEEYEEEVAPQEQAETMEPMEYAEVDIERPTSTMTEVVPQELASPVELAEQFDSMITTEVGSQQIEAGELVNIAIEGTP
jgi:hypothetical protein